MEAPYSLSGKKNTLRPKNLHFLNCEGQRCPSLNIINMKKKTKSILVSITKAAGLVAAGAVAHAAYDAFKSDEDEDEDEDVEDEDEDENEEDDVEDEEDSTSDEIAEDDSAEDEEECETKHSKKKTCDAWKKKHHKHHK